jgi:hypothetical protein
MIKTEYPGYVKDDTPGRVKAVLNTDNASLQAYKDARAKDIALTKVVGEVSSLKNDIGDIKKLLSQLINGNK